MAPVCLVWIRNLSCITEFYLFVPSYEFWTGVTFGLAIYNWFALGQGGGSLSTSKGYFSSFEMVLGGKSLPICTLLMG